MTARTMTARYPGTCRGCGDRITAGSTIRHEGHRRTYHAECGAGAATYTAENDPYNLRGRTWKQRYGRCEDAPCCGCCD